MIGQECGIFGHDFLIDGAAALRISIDSDVIMAMVLVVVFEVAMVFLSGGLKFKVVASLKDVCHGLMLG